MKITVKSFTGNNSNPYKEDLAKLRIQVFREFPYLYDGTIEYEEKYLETFIRSEESIVVVAFDGPEVVGVSTGIPLKYEPLEIRKAWEEADHDLNKIFYFSESVLKKACRGQGIGVKFFEEREKWARQLNYQMAVFCAVIRAEDHPRRPKAYIPLDAFWKKRGFDKKNGFRCKMSWKEIDDHEEQEKELQFWFKNL